VVSRGRTGARSGHHALPPRHLLHLERRAPRRSSSSQHSSKVPWTSIWTPCWRSTSISLACSIRDG